jgi:hypothetical protein
MTEQPAPRSPTTTLPPQSAGGTSAELPSAPSPTRSGPTQTRMGGMRTSRIASSAGAMLMAAAGTARITRLRQVMRGDRRKPPTS